jgi:hypothetical protein
MKKTLVVLMMAAVSAGATLQEYQAAKAAYLALPVEEQTRQEFGKVVAALDAGAVLEDPVVAADYLELWLSTPYTAESGFLAGSRAWQRLGQTNSAVAHLTAMTTYIPDPPAHTRDAEAWLKVHNHRHATLELLRAHPGMAAEEKATRIAGALLLPAKRVHSITGLIDYWGLYGQYHPTIKPMSRLYGTLEAEYKPVFAKGAQGLKEAGWWSDNVTAKIVLY